MDFDFDPDEMEDEIEEELEAAVEEEVEEIEAEEQDESEEDDKSYLGKVAVCAAIVGIAEEYGRDEAKREAQAKNDTKTKDERPDGAVSLKAMKESKLPKFEQHVKDVILGKKEIS